MSTVKIRESIGVDTSSMFLRCYESSEFIELNGKYILEIESRDVGSLVYNHLE